jgi:hypothetical protein
MPFPTLTTARQTDLSALEEALRAMISQQRIGLATGGLPAGAFREKTIAAAQVAAVQARSRARWAAFTPLAIMVAVFAFAMVYRDIYGLQALRQAHGVIELGLVLAAASFFVVRWRKRKSA